MAHPKSKYRDAVAAYCKSCNYDPLAPGNWREQVADCANANCVFFDLRPVPRKCLKGGVHDREAIAALRADLAERQGRQLARQRAE